MREGGGKGRHCYETKGKLSLEGGKQHEVPKAVEHFEVALTYMYLKYY